MKHSDKGLPAYTFPKGGGSVDTISGVICAATYSEKKSLDNTRSESIVFCEKPISKKHSFNNFKNKSTPPDEACLKSNV